MINLQYYTFKLQSTFSAVILESALLITFYLINYVPTYNYDSHVVLDNSDFNMLICTIGGMGILSVCLSIKPSWVELCKLLKKEGANLDRIHSVEVNKIEEER